MRNIDNKENRGMVNNQMGTQKQRKIAMSIGVVVMLLAMVLALAACQPSGGQPADQAAQPRGFGGNGQGFGGGNGQRPNFQMQPAAELPTTQPVVRGFVVSRNGNDLVIQMGNPNFRQGQGGQGQGNGQGNGAAPSGTPRVRPTIVGAGTDVTVTVASDTVIYQDVTFASLNGQPPANGTIQQKVEKISVDALSNNERVTVWGTQNGNEVAAQVIVYSQPRNFQQQQ